jgi:hypothetical protein
MTEVTGGAMASLSGVRELSACAQSLAGALEKDSRGLGILTELPHLVWWKDLEGRYLGSNRAYTRARGLPGTADLVGRLEDDLSVVDAFTTTLPALERSVITSGVPATGVQSLSRPGDGDGDGLKILLTVVPLRTAEGGVYGVIGVGADVSGLSDIDRKVSQASRLESIGRLTANIAHQINTPIRFLTDNTRFVADGVAEALTALQAVQSLAMSRTAEPAETCLDEICKVIVETDVDFLDAELPSVKAFGWTSKGCPGQGVPQNRVGLRLAAGERGRWHGRVRCVGRDPSTQQRVREERRGLHSSVPRDRRRRRSGRLGPCPSAAAGLAATRTLSLG